MLLGFFILGLVVLFWVAFKSYDKLTFTWPIALGLILLVSWLISYGDSIGINGRLVAGRENIPIYLETAKRLNDLAVVEKTADGALIGGLENLKQSTNASEALITLRDAVVRYNSSIEVRRAILRNPLLWGWCAPLPEGIATISAEELFK